MLLRRLLPATVLVPFVLGWLISAGEHQGWYSQQTAWALFAPDDGHGPRRDGGEERGHPQPPGRVTARERARRSRPSRPCGRATGGTGRCSRTCWTGTRTVG